MLFRSLLMLIWVDIRIGTKAAVDRTAEDRSDVREICFAMRNFEQMIPRGAFSLGGATTSEKTDFDLMVWSRLHFALAYHR